MRRIKIGIVGCGYWGPNVIRNFSEVSEADVVACCDLKKERLKYIKQRFPYVDTYTDYCYILGRKDIDAVSICTPVSSHFALAKDALLAHKHVLVEKPITYRCQEAEELIELSGKNKCILMAGHTFEYSGAVNKMKEIIHKGELGDVLYFDSARANLGIFHRDVNVVWDLASHDISIILYILGKLPKSVVAIGKSYVNKGIEDVAYINLFFPNNIIAHIHVSWLAPVKLRKMVVAGTKKMIIYDDVENIEKVKVFDKGVDFRKDNGPQGILERQLFYRSGDIIVPQLDTTEPLKNECMHFVSSIRKGKSPVSDGVSGLRVVKILEAINRSMNNGAGLEYI